MPVALPGSPQPNDMIRLADRAYKWIENIWKRDLPNDLTLATRSVVEENALSGNSGWWKVGDWNFNLLGFPTVMTVEAGEEIDFKVSSQGEPYVLDIYRLGSYGGDGAKLYGHLTNDGSTQSDGTLRTNGEGGVGSRDCIDWTVTDTWTVPVDATHGVYLPVLKGDEEDSGTWMYLSPFSVTNDRSRVAPVLVIFSDMTWHAYNSFGTIASPNSGKSIYGEGGGVFSQGGRAWDVSYDRPMMILGTNESTGATVPQTAWQNGEMPCWEFLERNGVEVAYASQLDIDADPSILDDRQVLVMPGHNEYWSQNFRDAWDSALADGSSALLLTGNTLLWRTRMDGRLMYCYKDSHTLSGTGTGQDPVSWTGTWRDPRWANHNGENTSIGALFVSNGVRSDTPAVPYSMKSLELWRDTTVEDLTEGQTRTLKSGSLGMEWDTFTTYYANNQEWPAGLKLCSLATVNLSGNTASEGGDIYNETVPGGGNVDHHVVAFPTSGNGFVVNFGADQWAWGLSDFHCRGTAGENADMQQAMINCLVDMGVPIPTKMPTLTTPTPTEWAWPTITSLSVAPATVDLAMGNTEQLVATATWTAPFVAERWTGANGSSWSSDRWEGGRVTAGVVTHDVQGNSGHVATTASHAVSLIVPKTDQYADFDVTVAITRVGSGSSRNGFLAYRIPAGDNIVSNFPVHNFYEVGITDTLLYIEKVVSDVRSEVKYHSLAMPGTGKRWLRVRVRGSQHQAKAWDDGSVEPSVWQIDQTDTSLSAAGRFQLGTYSSEAIDVYFDDLDISAPSIVSDVSRHATWASTDEDVAAVTAGLVTPGETGTATITATYLGQSDTCAVTVTAASELIHVWDGADPTAEYFDTSSYELGTRFSLFEDITVVGLRIWNPGAQTRTRKIHLWNDDIDQQLAEADAPSLLANGWNEVEFDVPIALTTGVNYIASYNVQGPNDYGAIVSGLAGGVADDNVFLERGMWGATPGQIPTNNPENFYGVDLLYSLDVIAALSVTPPTASIEPEDTQQLTATHSIDGDVTATATWGTSNAAIATVSSTGLVTAVAEGTCTITATYTGGLSDTCVITVVPDVAVRYGWNGTDPTYAAGSNSTQYALGTRFAVRQPVRALGVRVYLGSAAADIESRIVKLWKHDGTLLASKNIDEDSDVWGAGSWREFLFDTPIDLPRGDTVLDTAGWYMVSHTVMGYFVVSGAFNGVSPETNDKMVRLLNDDYLSGDNPGNGVFNTTITAMPGTTNSSGVFYGVDLIYEPIIDPPDYDTWKSLTDTPPLQATDNAISVGTRWHPTEDVLLYGVRYWRTDHNYAGTPPVASHCLAGSGTATTSQTGNNSSFMTAAGWEDIIFDAPISCASGVEQAVWVTVPNSGYGATSDALITEQPSRNGLFTIRAGGGRYQQPPTSSGATEPTTGFNNSYYWVEPLVLPGE